MGSPGRAAGLSGRALGPVLTNAMNYSVWLLFLMLHTVCSKQRRSEKKSLSFTEHNAPEEVEEKLLDHKVSALEG